MANAFETATRTFVAELPSTPLDEALRKFEGRRTWRMVRAAQRMASKPTRLKIPGYALKALWRLTGGWRTELKAGWPKYNKKPEDIKPAETLGSVGELKVFLDPNGSYPTYCFQWRGASVAHLAPNWGDTWNKKGADAALRALG